MTSQAHKPVARRRLLLAVSLAGVILLVAWITNSLLGFDLNDYRRQAEERISAMLSLPVKIGAIHYSLHDTSLALQLTDLQIGNSSSHLQADVAKVLIDLQWWGLLRGDIQFARVSLLEPRIQTRRPTDRQPGAAVAALSVDRALLASISIDRLEVHDGTLLLEFPGAGLARPSLEITALDGELVDLHLNRTAQLSLHGELRLAGQQSGSAWQLQGAGALDLADGRGLTSPFELELKVKNLDLEACGRLLPAAPGRPALAGSSNLTLSLSGSPAAGIAFQVALASEGVSLAPGPAYAEPLTFKNLLASGLLQTVGDRPGISNLALQLDETRVAGSLAWTPVEQPFAATITLVNSSLAVTQLKRWLPDNRQEWQPLRHKLLDQGVVQIELVELSFFGDPAAASEAAKPWRLERFKGEVQELAWLLDNGPRAEISTLPFALDSGRWQIDSGRGQLGSLHLAIAGTGAYGADGLVLSALEFSGELSPDALREEWQIPAHALATRGQVGIQGRLQGALNQLSLDMQVDLSQLSLAHPAGLQLSGRPGDKLALHASLSPQRTTLDHGALRWSIVKGHVSATSLHGDPDSLALEALLAIDDLAGLHEVLPVLDKLQLQGQAELSISQQGWPASGRAEMILTLRDVALRATSHIAGLSKINGRVQLTPTGLVADNLRVQLGQSPLTVQARLADFSNPRLSLEVRAPTIRADELVFTSRQALLRDIVGRLEIDRKGLSFAPVAVRLDGGTDASVRGTIAFQPPYAVQLDITSEFARIGEVVALWGGRAEPATDRAATTSTDRQAATATAVRINATVRRGDLYGMSFHDAAGVIVPSRARLVIHPLDFAVGSGSCNAQVITDFAAGRPSLLRISGHAEEVDALEVYRELLQQKNIVRGRLRGDFHLSGEIGSNFLPSSSGNFSIQIRDGVLHQFPVLSKVFSLLNVSQIFAMQLPDMDREGMPFTDLKANFALNQGVLSSQDLKIESAAMNQSYVGEFDLVKRELDFAMAIHPLGTVDKLVSRIPVAGWLLTGKDKALLSAHFAIKGRSDNLSVTAMPLDTFTQPTIGLLRRTLGLPFKLLEDPQILWGGEGSSD